jgi:TRAP-type C4-dicarboxylate transport system substrate-binding protein
MYLGEIMSTPRKVRWLIAHQPQELFVRTARAFSEELAKLCGNELDIEILTYPEYVEKYHEIPGLEEMVQRPEDLNTFEEIGIKSFWNALFDSEIEMSQIQVVRVGELNNDFFALDLPFLFEDHDHVQRVVEGPTGQKLCKELGEKSGVTGLAFTYSGGYRVVGSHKPITSLDELSKMTIAVQQPLSLGTTIESMGGGYIASAPNLWHKYDPMVESECDAVETTYLRFNEVNGKHILKTNHSMFMTTIVVSNKFWNSLTETQQIAFRNAATAASRQERKWSIEDAAKFESQAVEKGITIINMSNDETNLLKKTSQLTYAKSKFYFSNDLVREIRKQK